MTIILHHEKCEPFGRAFYVSSIVVFSTLTARYIIASRNREPVLRDVTVEKVRKHGKNKFNFARIKNYQLKVSTEVWARMRLALEEIESPHQKL